MGFFLMVLKQTQKHERHKSKQRVKVQTSWSEIRPLDLDVLLKAGTKAKQLEMQPQHSECRRGKRG